MADCERRQFPMICEPLTVQLGRRISKEAAGRDARYQRLAELGQPNAIFLLGHHRNDQKETFFLQLKRGAGPKGLAAMAMVSQREQQTWRRPLLDISKAEIYRYANQHQLFWIEDDTNYDTRIERNFLSHDIIPRLKNRWPAIEQTVLRSAELCAEHEALLNEMLDGVMQSVAAGNVLQLDGWQQRSIPMQKAILRRWFEDNGAKMPSAAVLNELIQQLERLPQGKVGVRWGAWAVNREKRQLKLEVIAKV